MNAFIYHTLTMLEDAGLSINYPKIQPITLDENGRIKMHANTPLIQGNRVSIEQNPQMKFLILFTLLDFHVDAAHPELEGKSYRQKYLNLPSQSDYNLVLRQLFRVAKIIRNALVHNQSSFSVADNHFSVDYRHNRQHFCLKMSREAFKDFHTAIIMYVRGDMGKGSYFLGIMRSMYASILAGITEFNDDFGSLLEQPTTGIKMNRHQRYVVLHPPYEACGGALRFPVAASQIPEYADMDFYFSHNDTEYLVPREALDEKLSIMGHDLIVDWKREGYYPQVKVS